MRAVICEKWEMSLQPGGESKWFLDWALRSPGEVSLHLSAGFHAYASLLAVYPNKGDIQTCREFFGGIGAQSLMIQHFHQPEQHMVQDYSLDAVRHLKAELPERIQVQQGDSYAPDRLGEVDLVGLDFGDLTVWKTREGEKHRGLLDRVFAAQPKAVVLTDIAGPRLHLHRERYDTLLGSGACASYATYIEALSRRLRALYGYRLLAAYSHRWSTVLSLIPAGVPTMETIGPTPSTPVGFSIIGATQ